MCAIDAPSAPAGAARDGTAACDAAESDGFSLVETMIAMLVLTIGLVGLAQLLAVSIVMHSDARHATTITALAQAKMDELMKKNFTDASVSIGGSLSSSMLNYSDAPGEAITRRWRVTTGPTTGTRWLEVSVENKGGRLYGTKQSLTTVIRDW
jgi:prepilin-type N-terminal cleavage/methylation domain-containing protein